MTIPEPSRPRNRWHYLAFSSITIALGLLSRSDGASIPDFIHDYAGDTLWAALFFLLLAIAFPAASTSRLAIGAITIAFGIELLQLASWPWLIELRQIPVARFLLGTDFLWSDLICLGMGVALATWFDLMHLRKTG